MATSGRSGLAMPAVIITLLAAMGIGPTLMRPSSSSPTVSGGKSSAPPPSSAINLGATNGGYEHGAGHLLEDFFFTFTDEIENKKAWANGNASSLEDNSGDFAPGDSRGKFSIRFLIATLPLPTSPPLRYLFDAQLDAIESAAGRAHYSLDRFDLPWLDEAKDHSGEFQFGREIDIAPSQDDGQKASGQPTLTLKPNTDSENRWRRDSGVLLFRNDRDKRLLVVFLVAETPTRGVNKLALRDALDQVAWLHGWKPGGSGPAKSTDPPPHLLTAVKKSADADVKIVGPSFSGSAASLRNVLEEWLRFTFSKGRSNGAPSNINIISGTATAIAAGEFTLPPDLALPRVTFQTLQIPDFAILTRATQDIRNGISATPRDPETEPHSWWKRKPDKPRPDIALLTENTEYGMEAGEPEPSAEKPAANKPNALNGVLRLTFPLHISDLRTAFTKRDQVRTPTGPDLNRHNLSLPDENGQERRDVVPPFSARAAIYDELVLNNLLTTIHRERIRYVGVIATDVEDLIFLAQQIRSSCPDTVVFTTSTDVRFIHSEVNTELRGMLVFATYPLFGLEQNWIYPFEGEANREVFPSDLAKGVFNATLAQLGWDSVMIDYGEPFAVPHNGGAIVVPGHPPQFLASTMPVLQIGVVGHDEIWPLAFQVLRPPPTDLVFGATRRINPSLIKSPLLDLGNGLYPPVFEVFFFLLNAVLLVCSAMLLRAGHEGRWWSRLRAVDTPWWLDLMLVDAESHRFPNERRLYLATFAVGMFMAEMIGLGYALLPIWVALRLPSGIAPLRSLGLSLGIVLLLETLTGIVVLCAAIWTVLRAWKSWSKADRAPTAAWALLLLIGVATGVALFFVAQMWLRHPPAFALFAFLRGSHLGSGVSPLMPMVFLSIAGFSVMACLIWRVFLLEDRPLGRLTDRLTEKSPFLGFEDADGSTSFRGVSREENSIVDLLEGPLERLPGGPYLIGGLVFAFFYFGITRLRTAYSVDGLGFDILFMVQAFMVYGVFSLSLLRFVSIWIALRRLLRRLYFHPTRYSYKDIQLASSPHHLDQQNIRLFEPRPSLTAVEYCLATVRQILRIADESDSALSTGVKDKREELEDAMREVEAQLTPGLAAEADLDANQRPDRWAAVTARADAQKKMAELSKIVVGIFERVWRLGAKPLSKVVTSGEEGKPSADERLLAQVELFIAVRVVDFLRQIFPQLMNLVGFSMAGVVAMMLAVSAYPFPASETLLWFGWVVLVLAILTSLSVFVGINRNPILSMITGTEPGHFNWDSAFTLHLLMFGIIPVLTLLGAQYPHALSGTFSWIGALFGSGAGGM